MAKLIYSAITSLDGYIEDDAGKFDWDEPGEEVHAFVNDLERGVGTYLSAGRRQGRVLHPAASGVQRRTRIERRFGNGVVYLR
jgi:hypothetical protein